MPATFDSYKPCFVVEKQMENFTLKASPCGEKFDNASMKDVRGVCQYTDCVTLDNNHCVFPFK